MENKKKEEIGQGTAMTKEDFAALWKTICLKVTDTYEVPQQGRKQQGRPQLTQCGGKVRLYSRGNCCRICHDYPSLSLFCRMVSRTGVPSRPKVERIWFSR